MIADKTCRRCLTYKAADSFGKRSRSKDGLQDWCKECKRNHYVDNRDSVLETQAKYRAENRDRVLDRKRQAYHRDAESNRQKNRQYRRENADQISANAKIRYGNGGRPVDKPWPVGNVAYSTAHQRVRATYGAAKNYLCKWCGERAHAWAYDHTDPNQLLHQGVGLWANKSPVPYSPDPSRYDPLCRSCHVKRDRYGAE